MSDGPELDAELTDALERMTGAKDRPRHRLTRFVILRGLGFVYAMAFFGAVFQAPGLIDSPTRASPGGGAGRGSGSTTAS